MMSLLVQLIINSAGYNILDVELWLFSDEVGWGVYTFQFAIGRSSMVPYGC